MWQLQLNKHIVMKQQQAGGSSASRGAVLAWAQSLLGEAVRAEELGKGSVYCRLINHYFPGVILISRIIWNPKSEYENLLNLRILQNALLQLKIPLPLDPIRLSKEKPHDNWPFLLALHRYLTHASDDAHPPQQPEPAFYHPIAPKRADPFPEFYGVMRQPFYPIDNLYQQHPQQQQKSLYNASKYSVGKLYKEPAGQGVQGGSSPNKGKWSVNSHMFQNNLVPIIDRVKEILLKSSHDTEKVRQVKMLLNIPLNEEVVKVEDDDCAIIKLDPKPTPTHTATHAHAQ